MDDQAPQRVYLVNTETTEELFAQYNPEGFEESIGSAWATLTIPGLSHEPMQFTNTRNWGTKLEFFFSAEGPGGSSKRLDEARKFFMQLMYPSGSAESIDLGGPPRALLFWPNVLAMEVIVKNLKIKHELFFRDLSMRQYRAELDIEEIRDTRILGSDVRRDGTIRIAPGGSF